MSVRRYPHHRTPFYSPECVHTYTVKQSIFQRQAEAWEEGGTRGIELWVEH